MRHPRRVDRVEPAAGASVLGLWPVHTNGRLRRLWQIRWGKGQVSYRLDGDSQHGLDLIASDQPCFGGLAAFHIDPANTAVELGHHEVQADASLSRGQRDADLSGKALDHPAS